MPISGLRVSFFGVAYGDWIMRSDRLDDVLQLMQLAIHVLERPVVVDCRLLQKFVGLEDEGAGG